MEHLQLHLYEIRQFELAPWLLLAAYLLGSVPWGLVIAKVFLGFDPRTKGSGNIGMTNVMRTGGKKAGIATFLLDFGKGFLAVWLCSGYFHAPEIFSILAGFLAVLGHTKSVFLKFTGGKGVATNFGVWAALDWRVFLALAALWVGVFLWKKISSLAALTALALMPLVVFLFESLDDRLYLASLLSIYLIILHKSNIARLLGGAEGKLKTTKEKLP
ncbi:MAG: acyl-phosphate glycerol 3-phosphate acyltransferase [Candidatus Lambdaproteobacteria bacterium RIFOXYD1_FULL_56_27]|uniref:Glycerol-3-phosphate acyltransferase n=1 Tax=Candidatus Lambdaproteobacteria bacterium RIFOXYD2_FULL_56_26 TaxID=1817773 RepID=A0A1F6H3E3_9PROT|nr:MAG: acyl-phosphate glycerol 3-phosphate acyltransferase [Candidatus Lambdaproteobacteria bacterium RIFOXYC1_FULL_56_13]OGH04891.1 MAG: acyl-phosphate glycerol 3-phosphate acyltransferase [Candidatus Lambdaproteobacteria bacterium RIFOXYD2_FULL_56_26]OGH09356.1 MAG: acyl-phosphate glycerol 3-phosphate acyltransferase [Candidatus Lambdaproteobacteria bacterium RIFOXYD1_FULL_56_27]